MIEETITNVVLWLKLFVETVEMKEEQEAVGTEAEPA